MANVTIDKVNKIMLSAPFSAKNRTFLFAALGTAFASFGLTSFLVQPSIHGLGGTMFLLAGTDFLLAALWRARWAVFRARPAAIVPCAEIQRA